MPSEKKKKLSFTVTAPPAEDSELSFTVGDDAGAQAPARPLEVQPEAVPPVPQAPVVAQVTPPSSGLLSDFSGDPILEGGKSLLGAAETTLSIASGAVGFMLGAANSTIGLVKNTADLTLAGIAKAGAWPAKGVLPELYDNANKFFIQAVDDIPADLQSDFNVWSNAITYGPLTETGKRYSENISKGMQTARTAIGDFAAGIPHADPNSPNFETESLAELEAVQSLNNGFTGELRKVLGAAGQSSIDVALMLIGGKVGSKLRTPVPVESDPVPGLKPGKLTVAELDGLQDSKPRFKNMEEATARLQDLASGTAKQNIVVETVNGTPTRVVSGQDMILAMKELEKRGQPVPEVPIYTFERMDAKGYDAYMAQRAAQALQRDETATRDLVQGAKKGLKERLINGLLDQKGGVKKALVEANPEIGREAVKHLELAQGATQRAIMYQADAWGKIYKDLSPSRGSGAVVLNEEIPTERALFDRFIRAQRIISLERAAKGKTRQPRFEAGTSGKEMANWLEALRQSVPEEKWADYNIRAQEYFDVSRKILDKYLEEGIISSKKYSELKDINYVKTDFVNEIDPVVDTTTIEGQVVPVGGSGIPPLPIKGGKGGVVIDSEALLNDLIIRSENRISRNRASQQLVKLAQLDPKNKVVRMARKDKQGKLVPPPKGIGLVRVMVNGKEEGVYLPEPLADQWKFADPQISAAMANTFRVLSGTAVLKPLATGYNPAFVLANIPRDLVHIQLSTSGIYSPHTPLFLAQIARDVASVAKDSLTFGKKFRDYIDDGGGQELLAHQGRDVLLQSYSDVSIRHRPAQKRLKQTLGYLNEQSELMLRLAIRERVLRNQKAQGLPEDRFEATWQARRYLDFAQGGSMTKAFDNIVPYTNVAVQAFKTIARNAKEHPGEFAIKASWVMALYGGWHARNYLFYKDTMDQIPEDVKARNLIIPTKNFIIDEFGNKRFEYYTVAKDPSIIPMTFWMERWLEKYMTGEAPTDSGLKYMTQTLPDLSGIPTINAFWTYQSDFNPWYDKNIFGRDLNVEDYAKFKGFPGTPTPEIFKDFSEIFNLKPEALAQATRQVVPNNFYVQMAGHAYDEMYAPLDPLEQSRLTEERWARTPGVNRIYHLTHPATKELEDMDRIAKEVNTPVYLQTKDVDALLYKASIDGNYQPAFDKATSMMETDPLLAKDMITRTIAAQKLDAIFDASKEEFKYMPASKYWWLGLMRQPSRVRAEVFYEKWYAATSQKERNWLDSTAATLSKGELSFMDKEFLFHLSQLKSQRNNDLQVDGPQ